MHTSTPSHQLKKECPKTSPSTLTRAQHFQPGLQGGCMPLPWLQATSCPDPTLCPRNMGFPDISACPGDRGFPGQRQLPGLPFLESGSSRGLGHEAHLQPWAGGASPLIYPGWAGVGHYSPGTGGLAKAARGHAGGYAPLASSSQANMRSGPQSTFLLCRCRRKQPPACRPPWTHRLGGGGSYLPLAAFHPAFVPSKSLGASGLEGKIRPLATY